MLTFIALPARVFGVFWPVWVTWSIHNHLSGVNLARFPWCSRSAITRLKEIDYEDRLGRSTHAEHIWVPVARELRAILCHKRLDLLSPG